MKQYGGKKQPKEIFTVKDIEDDAEIDPIRERYESENDDDEESEDTDDAGESSDTTEEGE